jgi:hypothetical protein
MAKLEKRQLGVIRKVFSALLHCLHGARKAKGKLACRGVLPKMTSRNAPYIRAFLPTRSASRFRCANIFVITISS